ncbi:hypothetical protein DC522_28515 [Microvirga sp. KLBC 81]|nr:hypothetical protein DC522_28515 [Microvirga sp. KLBC 81]
MTNMDDQVAKHIREMILKATRRATEERKPRSVEEMRLHRAVAILRNQAISPHELQRHTDTKPSK